MQKVKQGTLNGVVPQPNCSLKNQVSFVVTREGCYFKTHSGLPDPLVALVEVNSASADAHLLSVMKPRLLVVSEKRRIVWQ